MYRKNFTKSSLLSFWMSFLPTAEFTPTAIALQGTFTENR